MACRNYQVLLVLSYMIQEQIQPLESGATEKQDLGADLAEVVELKNRLEKLETRFKKEAGPEEREKLVKQEIKTYIQELQQVPLPPTSTKTRDEADEIKSFEPSQQVGALVILVSEKGLNEAISVALALDNPAILDEFHDTLVDHYYQVLVEKEIVKFI